MASDTTVSATPDVQPTQASTPAAAPITAPDVSGPLSGTPAQTPNLMPQPVPGQGVTTTPGPAKPGLWAAVLQGALTGLAGSAGQKHFGGGLGAGAENVERQEQLQKENAIQQQQMQFESVKAADAHIAALNEHRRADQLDQEGKLDYAAKSADYQAFLQDHFGIAPNLSFNDSHADATAGLTTLANQNGGKIPPVATIQQPAPDGEHGKVAAYSPSQQQFQSNMSGYRNLIDTGRAVQGLPPVDDATFNSLGFKGARDAANSALEALKPTPAFSLDKSSSSYLPVVLAQKQQQLAQYQAHKDVNGKPDADPAVVSQLEHGVDYLQKSWDSGNKLEAKQAADVTTAQEAAKKPFVEAEHQFQSTLQTQGKELDRVNADATARNLKADELTLTEKNTYATDIGKINDLKTTLAQAQTGNQAALPDFQVRFAENEIVQGGVKRMNQAELDKLTSSLGTYGRQLKTWADKGFQGDLPKATANDMGKILDAEAQSRTSLFQQRTANIDATIRPQGQAKPAASKTDPAAQFGGVTR